MGKKLLILFLSLIFIFGCSANQEQTKIQEAGQMSNLKLSSPAFENNKLIPFQYTCQGPNINPPLVIEGIPGQAKTLALIVDDPDAPLGTWVHWVMWNIPLIAEIEENSVPEGSVQGKSDSGDNMYQGPCPPSGTHRYYFKLYALDATLDLAKNSKKKDLESAMKGHILAKAELIGLYAKRQ